MHGRWYAHLAALAGTQDEGEEPGLHVAAGQLPGMSGVANAPGHLHLGLLLGGDVSQAWGTFLRAGSRLPRR